ncbi:MAG: hypothetical protein AAFY58_00670, partial [Planctomycetota bacterium]
QDDVAMFELHWHYSQGYTPGPYEVYTYFHGDVNGDGTVDAFDIVTFTDFFGGLIPTCIDYDLGPLDWGGMDVSKGANSNWLVPWVGGVNGDWYNPSQIITTPVSVSINNPSPSTRGGSCD